MSDLDQMIEALRRPEAAIKLVYTFTHGTGLQVMSGRRKVGPMLLPNEGETTGDLLRKVADLVDAPAAAPVGAP